MALLAYNKITPDGLALAASMSGADALGDTFPVDTNKVYIVTNDDAAPHTVTIAAPIASSVCGDFGSQPIEDIAVVVAAGETAMLTIPLGYGESGLFTLTYDAVTAVTVGGFALSVNG